MMRNGSNNDLLLTPGAGPPINHYLNLKSRGTKVSKAALDQA